MIRGMTVGQRETIAKLGLAWRGLNSAEQWGVLGAARHCHPGEMVRADNWEIIKPRHKT